MLYYYIKNQLWFKEVISKQNILYIILKYIIKKRSEKCNSNSVQKTIYST